MSFADLGFARVDLDRDARQGAPEAVLAEGKTPDEIEAIVRALRDGGASSVLVTRADAEARAAVRRVDPAAQEHERARCAWIPVAPLEPAGRVAIVSAGTSDGPAVHEARIRAELCGTNVETYEDCGVAGLDRLLAVAPALREADCVIVVAGMDAALASVVGGIVPAPVIAVPTSTGYGASLEGVTALLAMLSSCAAGVACVNIDDGFGAGTIAARIALALGGRVVTRVAYVDCVAGAAGDMLLAALIDAGAGEEQMAEHVRSLGVDGLDLRIGRVTRHGIVARTVEVVMPHEEHVHRRLGDMRALIDAAGMPQRAARRAHKTFRLLAEAEARMHDSEPELVHFHEVGGLDALADVCGVALALEELDIDRVECSPIPCARGFVEAAHGRLPLPAPATLELLRGAPLVPLDIGAELVTPTGAALIAATADRYGAIPRMTLENAGYGAGSRDLPQVPNIVRVLVGELSEEATPAGEVIVIETNLDDTPGELVPDAAARAFAAGALDVWTTPVQMKKGRPGVVLAALARPSDARAVAEAIVRETTALGVRMSRHERLELERRFRDVTVDGHSVRVKLGLLDGEVVNIAPEHDDCARAAEALGRPVKSVWAAALAAAEAPA